jgi:di/tricarboxylate transporter
VVTVAGMLVIAKGIVQTGVVSRITSTLLSATTSPSQAFRRLVGPIGVASALMVVGGVITPAAAARALDIRLLVILAGSIGLGTIVVRSGLADAIADAVRTVADGHAALVLLVFAVTTAVMTNLVTNAATASILTPVGIAVASELGIDPVTLLALIGTCVSFTFINPLSHQSNLMVMRPGGYTTRSFARFGVPLLLGSLVSVCLVAYLLL